MRKSFLVLFAVLSILFIFITWPFAKAAFLALTLAIIFFPVHHLARKRLKLPRYVASSITTFFVSLCVLFPLAVLSAIVVTKVGHFLQDYTSQSGLTNLSTTIQPILATIHDWINNLTGSAPTIEDLEATLISSLKIVGKKFYEFSPRMISTTLSVIINFFLTLIFLVVFLAEGESLYNWIMETSPISSEHRKELALDVRLTITSSIVAAVIIAIVQGSLLGLGFWIAGFNNPSGWGLVAVILCLIPVVGAASCYITAAVILLSTGDARGALLFLIYGFGIVSTIDNIIKPFLIRSSSKVHPLLFFVTLIGAVRLFGPIGLLVGPVLLSIFLASLRIYRREFVRV